MEDYTIYCTKGLTELAISIGAPCLTPDDYEPKRFPTAEQICGWLLQEHNLFVGVKMDMGNLYSPVCHDRVWLRDDYLSCDNRVYETYKEALYKALRVALEHVKAQQDADQECDGYEDVVDDN